jgi:hypothetical protein
MVPSSGGYGERSGDDRLCADSERRSWAAAGRPARRDTRIAGQTEAVGNGGKRRASKRVPLLVGDGRHGMGTVVGLTRSSMPAVVAATAAEGGQGRLRRREGIASAGRR